MVVPTGNPPEGLGLPGLASKKEILEERFNKAQLDDKKGREEVTALLSSSGKPLSADKVRIWVDNFKASLKKKKDGKDNQSAPNDKE